MPLLLLHYYFLFVTYYFVITFAFYKKHSKINHFNCFQLLRSDNKLYLSQTFIMKSIRRLDKKFCVKSAEIWSFFWSMFSRIRTEYGDLRSKSSNSVRIRENKNQKKLRI